ncbi:hypothetical protein HDU96_007273 [Phlyctochytrium bullatum]|nr:hypothetical protein HDU96_007273 [Phlyctochytrium bullatum]
MTSDKLGPSDATGKSAPAAAAAAPEGPSLLRALKHMFFAEVAPIGLLKFFADLCSVFSPLFVKYIIEYVQRGSSPDGSYPIGNGIGLIAGLFIVQIIGTLSLAQFQNATVAGMHVRTTLASVVYRKSMRMSAAARQEFGTGKIINVVATDCNRIEMFMTFIHILWTTPIVILLIISFLCSQLGWAPLVGISVLFISMPIQGKVMKTLMSVRKEMAPITDKRVKLTTEIIQGIRVIKFFAWESPFLARVQSLRNAEIALVFKRSLFQAIPVLAAVLALVVFRDTNPLDAAKVFSSLSWFTSQRIPLMFLPQLITGWAHFKVAVGRVQEVLVAPELEKQPEIDPALPYALGIHDAEFTWEAPKPEEPPAGAKGGFGWFGFMGPGGFPGGGRGMGPGPRGPGGPGGPGGSGGFLGLFGKKKAPGGPAKPGPKKPMAPVKPALKNINLTLNRGELVAVVCTVGCGKSSLLNAIVGEMKRTNGSVSFSGTMGYVPQTAWIQVIFKSFSISWLPEANRLVLNQNATLEQNITFGLHYDPVRYRKVIEACALESDLKVLPDGDQTSIGERGINLSGGQRQRVNLDRCVYSNTDLILLDDPLSAVDVTVGRFLFERCIQGALAGKTRLLVTHQLHFLPRVDRIVVMKDGEISEVGTYQELVEAGGQFAALMQSYGAQDEETASRPEKKRPVGPPSRGANIMQEEERATGGVSATIGRYIGVFCGWGIAQTLATYLFGLIFAFSGTRAARTLHDRAIERVLRAPARFFDTTPIGHIINRFSKDQDGIDNSLSDSYRTFANTLSGALATFVLICYATPLFVAPLVPVLAIYYFIQIVYRATSRELKRLDSVSRSPPLEKP